MNLWGMAQLRKPFCEVVQAQGLVSGPGTRWVSMPCLQSTRRREAGPAGCELTWSLSPDHLLADACSGHDGSPEMQPAPQNKRRLSLISNGRYEGSLPEEAASGKPAGEGPQPRVYTISGEPALLPGPEAEAIELAVVKGRRQREQHPHHHSQPLRASPGGSHEDVSRPCQSWAGSRQGSKECPGCAQLAPSPSPQAFGVDQPPLPEAPGRRKKLERMYSVDRVSGEGLGRGPGSPLCSSKRQEAWTVRVPRSPPAGGVLPPHPTPSQASWLASGLPAPSHGRLASPARGWEGLKGGMGSKPG